MDHDHICSRNGDMIVVPCLTGKTVDRDLEIALEKTSAELSCTRVGQSSSTPR
jgi:hypothetical protein